MESYQETTETVLARVQINHCVGDNFEILCLSYILVFKLLNTPLAIW